MKENSNEVISTLREALVIEREERKTEIKILQESINKLMNKNEVDYDKLYTIVKNQDITIIKETSTNIDKSGRDIGDNVDGMGVYTTTTLPKYNNVLKKAIHNNQEESTKSPIGIVNELTNIKETLPKETAINIKARLKVVTVTINVSYIHLMAMFGQFSN